MTDYTEATEAYDEAQEAWERFTDAMGTLGRSMRRIDPWLYERVDAYPGWDGHRDVGAGQDMSEWLEEIGKRIGAVDEEGYETCACGDYPAGQHGCTTA